MLSHWLLPRIAGLAAFADCAIYANAATNAYMRSNRKAMEAGTLWGPPGVPVVMPTKVIGLERPLTLSVGDMTVQFRHYHIHTRDSWAMVIPADRTLIPVTCSRTRSRTWLIRAGSRRTSRSLGGAPAPRRPDLPNHGDPDVIIAGGYTTSLIDAVSEYDRSMLRHVHDAGYLEMSIEEAIPNALATGAVSVWGSYRAAHRHNLELMLGHWQHELPGVPA